MDKRNYTGARGNRTRQNIASLVIACLITLVTAPAHSQSSDDDSLMAVMSVINMLLLDRDSPIPRPEGEGVVLNLGESISTNTGNGTLSPGQDSILVENNFFVEFELQQTTVEICFFLYTSEEIGANDITIEVNGKAQQAYFGENCIQVNQGQQRSVNYINVIVNRSGLVASLFDIGLQPTNQRQLGLPRLTRGEWDQEAVRKVLKIFAFGGHATDDQIYIWSVMKPADAIQEMLNFDEHNLKLSPLAPGEQYVESASQNGKLWDWQEWMRDRSSNMPIPAQIQRSDGSYYYPRDQYGLDGYNFDDAFNRMITVRGMNPFRQRIGFWETNYHLAVNRDAGVSRREIAAYYDLIMEAHEAGLPYYQVMGIAAKSAAIAEQYGHDRNQWRYDRELDDWYCACNEDFAREIHQLFYGIFGEDDPEHHENVTIPNTARMLTDMRINDSDETPSDVRVNFDSDDHYNSNGGEPQLSILKHTIPHSPTADTKIDYLMPLSMQHAESLKNLPIMVIESLADNNLSESKKSLLRSSWASMGVNRVLLDFIQAYAISELFHSADQIRYLTSHERALYMANKNNLENIEAYFGGGSYQGRAGRTVGSVINDDNAGEFFRPLHNVFGGQTPQEAADSALSFENNYNRLTDREYEMRDSVQCDECNLGQAWEKQWQNVLPRRADGNFYVADVARWLWVHATGSDDNYTQLEQAQLYSLLGAVRKNPGNRNDEDTQIDFTLLMCMVEDYKREEPNPDLSLNNILTFVMHRHCNYYKNGPDGYDPDEIEDLNRFYTGQEIADDPTIQALLTELGNETLPLESQGETYSDDLREHARERIQNALAFIFNTPFVFAEAR